MNKLKQITEIETKKILKNNPKYFCNKFLLIKNHNIYYVANVVGHKFLVYYKDRQEDKFYIQIEPFYMFFAKNNVSRSTYIF